MTLLQQRRGKILLWGDSLTQLGFEGWSSILANVYQRRADVINRGLAGYNTSWYLQYLHSCPDDVLLLPQQDHVVLVIIWFGANDASLPHLNPRQYVSISDYQQNLKTFIQLAHETHPHAKIMLVTPPPVVHEQRLQYQIQRYGPQLASGKLERTLENAGLYAQAALQVASECSVPCLNLWKEMQESALTPTTATVDNQSDADRTTDSTATPSWSRFFCDGLHFSKQGHDYVGRSIVEFIHASFPSLAVTADPLTGQWANVSSQCGSDLQQYHGPPFHEEIDPNNLQAAFDKSYPTNATESLE